MQCAQYRGQAEARFLTGADADPTTSGYRGGRMLSWTVTFIMFCIRRWRRRRIVPLTSVNFNPTVLRRSATTRGISADGRAAGDQNVAFVHDSLIPRLGGSLDNVIPVSRDYLEGSSEVPGRRTAGREGVAIEYGFSPEHSGGADAALVFNEIMFIRRTRTERAGDGVDRYNNGRWKWDSLQLAGL